MGIEAWNLIEDLPAHLKNHLDILLRRIDALTADYAWNILEVMATQRKNHPGVLTRRIDVLTGSEHLTKALMLAEGMVTVYSHRPDVWFGRPCWAQARKLEEGRESA